MRTPIYGHHNPAISTIESLLEAFESIGTVQNIPVPIRHRSARRAENIAASNALIEEHP